MLERNNNITTSSIAPIEPIIHKSDRDYGQILRLNELGYKQADHYWQSGEIEKTQGWILHISVVISQVEEMLKTIVPALAEENVPFKIPKTKQTCIDILNGDLGVAQIGKIVCIYPENNEHAIALAEKIIRLTAGFKGPRVPTDILLGNVVYTRYGSFNPVLLPDINGREEKYIYNKTGQLIKDPYSIPFELLPGIDWPFEAFTPIFAESNSGTLKNKYKILSILKQDVKGNVFQGIYLKRLLHIGKCVIKQGYQNMSSEETGRDIHDRLAWQQELYNNLGDSIPMPQIIDFFREDGNSYLVMKYIQGKSLFDKIQELNPSLKSWFQLNSKEAEKIINYLISIIEIITVLHEKGYVHRDIAPSNFMIDNKGRIYLIDMELAYSIHQDIPNPPFEYGTAGFMSPEQQAVLKPTIKEDIYGLGALMLELFSGLTPIKFNNYNHEFISKNVNFFIANTEISNIIQACLHPNPQVRPEIKEIQRIITKYKQDLISPSGFFTKRFMPCKIDPKALKRVIQEAIAGLNQPPIITQNDFWYSKMSNAFNATIFRNKEYTRYIGLAEGMGGVLYLLSRAKRVGFNIENCMRGFNKGLDFIYEQFLDTSPKNGPGLYTGYAGIALVLNEGIMANLIDNTNDNIYKIKNWIQSNNYIIDLANGITGQAIALLQCAHLLDKSFVEMGLTQHSQLLLKSQQNDGSWIFSSLGKEKEEKRIFSFGYGIPGIIWFLLEYGSTCRKEEILNTAQKGLRWLIKKSKSEKALSGFNEVNKRKGIILTLLKAFEVFKEEKYKKMVEQELLKLPSCIAYSDFTQKDGLAGLGELYIEAANVLNNEEWSYRSDWIANLLIHIFKRTKDHSGYWEIEERNNPTADFMTGTSGIIHFLLRYGYADKLGYRFLK